MRCDSPRAQDSLHPASAPTPHRLLPPKPNRSGSPETLRDPRGFAVKFYTREGNYDMVGNNIPVGLGRAGWGTGQRRTAPAWRSTMAER